jgi:hypothetical protein
MRDPLTDLAEAYSTDSDRAGPDALAHRPKWLVHCLAHLILFLLRRLLAIHSPRFCRPQSRWQDRPDLPAGSAQAEAASIRGQFGNAIAWMCFRRGIGPGHADWPELSRAIVAFGGSLKRFRAGAPALGLQWWDNPNVVPGTVTGFGVPAETATLLQRQAAANAAPPALNPMQARAVQAETGAHARLPASWLLAPVRHVLARAGPSPPTGPPGCPGLPNLSCLMHGAGAWPAPPY